VPRGGVRTIYRITDEGRAEFKEGLHRQFEMEAPVSQALYGGLLFLHLADPEAIKESLRRRIAQLGELIEKLKPIRQEMAPVISTGGDHLLRHLDKQRRLDREWLRALLADIEANGIRDLPDPEKLRR
jgi:DNA-binding PadR family transcriptional regulator